MVIKRKSLRPQDVVVLFSLLSMRQADWVVAEVANLACLSLSETHAAIGRLEVSGLLSFKTRRPVLDASKEFLLHGVKYVFPAEAGGRSTRGVPTAHSAPPLYDRIVGDDDNTYVWPCSYGKVKGTPVIPLYKTVPDAVQKDNDLYELLALTDAISVGRVRERTLAEELLLKKLKVLGEDLS